MYKRKGDYWFYTIEWFFIILFQQIHMYYSFLILMWFFFSDCLCFFVLLLFWYFQWFGYNYNEVCTIEWIVLMSYHYFLSLSLFLFHCFPYNREYWNCIIDFYLYSICFVIIIMNCVPFVKENIDFIQLHGFFILLF